MSSKLVHLRIGAKLLDEIDSVVERETFESRSEFIREILRKEVEEREKKQLIKSLAKRKGKGKREGIKELSSKELDRIREEVWNRLHERKKAYSSSGASTSTK